MNKPISNRKRKRKVKHKLARVVPDSKYERRQKKLRKQGWRVLHADSDQRYVLNKAGVPLKAAPGWWAPAWAAEIVHHPGVLFQHGAPSSTGDGVPQRSTHGGSTAQCLKINTSNFLPLPKGHHA